MKLNRETFLVRAEELNRDDEIINIGEKYLSNLLNYNLPIIFSTKHLSALLDIDYLSLNAILVNKDKMYKNLYLKKKNGKFRHIKAPVSPLKDVQKWINIYLLQKVKLEDYITSYRLGKSIKDNASFHTNSSIIVKIDLKDFYNHINLRMVYKLFRHLGYPKSISIDLAKLCTIKTEEFRDSILPQGAPTSPYISNIIGMELDRRLNGYVSKKGFRYSRYSDDITISSTALEDKISFSVIKKIITESGFIINYEKTKFLKKQNRQNVTGLNVNHGITISKKKRKSIETHLHNCITHGVTYHMQQAKIKKTNFRGWLLGNINYISNYHPEQGKRMKEKFHSINWLN